MPCTYYDDKDYLDQARKKVNELTKLLCEVTSYLHKNDNNRFAVMLQYVPGLNDWYQEHLEIDRRRVRSEIEEKERITKAEQLKKIRGKVLLKLSPEEIEALGIRDLE